MKLVGDKNRQMARRLAEEVAKQGGRVYYVGGLVRDRLMGHEGKDVDVEVHGVSPQVLEGILDGLGERTQMGKSFGIYGLRHYEIDIAMPRTEKANGRGHRDFAVFTDPFLGTEKAAKRRDFTVNAMMEDVLSGEIVDPFGGREDLKRGILRHVNDESFGEDPLRVLRGAQFAARFGFAVAEDTVALCKSMDLGALAAERVLGETQKALLKAPRPGVYFRLLREMDHLSLWFCELEGLFSHPLALSVLDEAASLRDRAREPLAFLFSALSLGLDEGEDFPRARAFLSRLSNQTQLHKYVFNMLSLFPRAQSLPSLSFARRNQIFDCALCPEDLLLLLEAHRRACGEEAPEREEEQEALARYRALTALPSVMGADLMAAGFAPGQDFAEALAYARRLHLEGIPKEKALPLTLGFLQEKRKKGGR